MNVIETLGVTIDDSPVNVSVDLLEKYNQPARAIRATPTAPEWADTFGEAQLREAFREANNCRNPLRSLSFPHSVCQSLCLYCGCNVVINKNHEVAPPYLDHLKREIDWVSAEVDRTRKVEQLHWGGGTPTYLSPARSKTCWPYHRSILVFGYR
jgi:oxygen-independent coproporphyrinogen-3 oxidase